MKKLVASAFVALMGLSATCGPALAETVNFSAPGVASSVTGLDVNGTFYDVTFAYEDNSVSTLSPFSDFNSASSAINALSSTFTDNSVESIFASNQNADYSSASLYYGTAGGYDLYENIANLSSSPPLWIPYKYGVLSNTVYSLPVAKFVAAVPIPASSVFLASGLVLMVALGLKRRERLPLGY